MDKYIEQLINDFKTATWNLRAPGELWDSADIDNENEVEDLSYVEQFVYGEEQKISEITGIETGQLPPVEKLTEEQASLLAGEMEELLNYFHFYPEFPEGVPGLIRYRLLREKWDSKQVAVSFGRVHLEFCDYEEENCPFPGYCTTCKEIREEEEKGPKSDFQICVDELLPSREEIEAFLFEQKKEEIKEKIKTLPLEKDHIPGIYNYCDRWCERCSFTARCASFSLGSDLNLEENDLSNKAFWDNLAAMFCATSELFTELAQEHGFDPANEPIEPINFEEDASHPLIAIAEDYTMKSTRWMNENSTLFQEKESQLFSIGNKDLVALNDALEVIRWYQLFIPAKIKRAFFSFNEPEEMNEAMYDGNGSAKIALIAIERSIEAYSVLLNLVKETEDEILQFMIALSKMKKELELIFPEAQSFVRPGFDEKKI